MAKLKIKFTTEVIIQDDELDFNVIIEKEDVNRYKRILEELIRDNEKGVDVKVKTFKWEVVE